ncbi:MAG: hypothetical protein GEU96_04935 [Propionibacteriales bacterium]|nr:hypothetical protein [Propionibacteriales bacterium]
MKTHPLNVTPLVFGLIFLGTASLALMYEADWIDVERAGWALPTLLVLAGVIGLAATLVKGSRGRSEDVRDDAAEPTHEPEHTARIDTTSHTTSDTTSDTNGDTNGENR